MPTLLMRFPGRRYHATPWGHHVNEGLIEWPPSPWRLLRALLSVGYSACHWPADLDEPWRSTPPDSARALIQALACVAPRYCLPPAIGTHSRHYMPMADFKNGQERTTLVFDAWAQIEGGELAVTWDVDLSPEQEAVLAQLAAQLNYLGRSESWVQARLANGDEASTLQHNCLPCDQAPHPGPGWEQVALLAPEPATTYAQWREAALQGKLATLPQPSGRGKAPQKLEAEREAVRKMFPADILSCLQVDTNWLRRFGWSQPPGSRKLLYWRRSDALQAPVALQRKAPHAQAVRGVLLALASQSRNDHALPALARTLPQAEMLHRQVLGAFGKLGAGSRHSAVLSGRDADGRPLRGAHGHAHLLPLDLDADGHIEHLLLWAPDGLSAEEQAALRHVRSTYTKGSVGPLHMAWVGAGAAADLAMLPAPLGLELQRTLGVGQQWISATPFVPPRHLKARGAHTLEGQLHAELKSRGLPEPKAIQWLDPQQDHRARRLRHYVRVRRFGPEPAMNLGFALRLQFATPVAGPLCLGYGSHFGLGRFERDPEP